MSSKNDLHVFEKIAAQKQHSFEPRPQAARGSGWVIGALAGLAYGLTSVLLPALWMPGAPLAYPPFGALGNVLAAGAIGAALGGVCLLPAADVVGALLAAGLLWGLAALRVWAGGFAPLSPLMNQALGMYLFLLGMALAGLGVPYFWALRQAAERQGELWRRPLWDWRRVQLPLALILLAALAAGGSLPSERVRTATLRMNNLVLAGRGSPGAPPGPLADGRVQDFGAHAHLPYTLEYSPDEALRADLARIVAPLDVVIRARFADGYQVACMFKDGIDLTLCKSYPAQVTPQ